MLYSADDVSSTSSGTSAVVYVASQCFRVPGVPTFRLWCPPASDGGPQLVRVIQTFYGVPPWNTTCGYRSSAGHCVQLADLPAGVQCSGRYHCTIHVSNPYLMSCRAYAVYMQVNYTCVPSTLSALYSLQHTTKIDYVRPIGILLRKYCLITNYPPCYT